MNALAVLAAALSMLTTDAVLAQAAHQPPLETVAPSELRRDERAVAQARAAWEAAARDLEGDLLRTDAGAMLARIGRARETKGRELEARVRLFARIADQVSRTSEWLAPDVDMVRGDQTRVTTETIEQRQRELQVELRALAKAGTRADPAVREGLQIQIERLEQLRLALEDQASAHQDLREEDVQRRQRDLMTRDTVSDFSAQMRKLAADVEHERALWDRYYDTLEEAVEGSLEGEPPVTPVRVKPPKGPGPW